MRFPQITLIVLLACVLADITSAQPALPGEPLPAGLTNSKPFKRLQWKRERRAYPAGSIPDGALVRGWQQVRDAKLAAGGFHPASAVPGNTWAPIGPTPIVNGQTSPSGPVSGRVSDLVVNPTNYSHWLASGADGGVWETRNAGASWRPLTDDQPSISIGAMAFAPGNPSVIYVGTGEQATSATPDDAVGLLRSTDGGVSWQLLASATFTRSAFGEIRVHPTNADFLEAATGTGLWKSINGGVTWTRKLSGVVTDLEIDPASFTNQFCAVGANSGGAANGVYRSTNGGETWSAVAGPWSTAVGGVGRIEMAIAPSARGTLYVSVQDAFGSGGTDGASLGLWRTTDAWATTVVWTQLPTVSAGTQLWYDHEVVVDPVNPSILYFGEVNLRKFDGANWASVLGPLHVDQQCMAWAGNRLIAGNDGGVWSSVNGGSSWVNHNPGLQITQFYHGTLSPTDPNFALGGAQDNGTSRWAGTNGWRLVLGGDGADCVIASASQWAVSYQYQAIQRTRNNGGSFDAGNSGLVGDPPFIGAFAKAWHNQDIFIAATTVLNKCTNFFSAGTPTWFSNGPALGGHVDALAFARSDLADLTYAYSDNNTVRITTNGGAAWRDLDALSRLPNRTITSFAFHPTNANILYATLSGFDENSSQPGHVYRSVNALATQASWSDVSYPANVPANSIVIDRNDPNVLYVGTDLGVWKSLNAGASWSHMGPEVGLPNVPVSELALENTTGRLIAFTYGRGAYVLTLSNVADLVLTQVDRDDPAAVGCPFTYALTVSNRGPANANGVFVTNRAPANATFAAASSSQGTFTRNGSTIVFNLGSVPASTNVAMTVSVTPVSAGPLTNQVTVRATQTDQDPASNNRTETTQAIVDAGILALVSAVGAGDGGSILLTFSKGVAPASATDPANYTLLDGLSNAVSIASLQPGPSQKTVILQLPLLTHVGPYFLTVRNVQDCGGTPMPSDAFVVVTLPAFTLVAAGSVWKYLDTGVDQAAAWRSLAFNDSGWTNGPAQLGYGDDDERTMIAFGPDSNARFITYYFRQKFVVSNPAVLTNLVVNLLRDDGGVVYINGVEVFRSNLPGGTISFGTPASATVNNADESTFFAGAVAGNPLVFGTNVIAVEIHQASATSSDVSFDLALTANLKALLNPPLFIQQPESQTVLTGDTVTFTAAVSGTPLLGYAWLRGSTFIVPFGLGTPTLTLANVQLADAGPYRLIVTNAARISGVSSAIAELTVLLDTDGDRIPDAWETAHGFNPNSAVDALIDSDLDGFTNLQEYTSGTDPRDPQSYLRVDEIASGTGGISVRFNAVSNRTYTVLQRFGPGSGPWSKLADVDARTTNRVATVFDTSPDARQRFYRLSTPRQP